MKILHLHLKKKYWDQIKEGTKTFEYRKFGGYWKQRLIGQKYDCIKLYCGYPKSGDKDKILVRRWRGVIRAKINHEEFGGVANVFAIDVSEPVEGNVDVAFLDSV